MWFKVRVMSNKETVKEVTDLIMGVITLVLIGILVGVIVLITDKPAETDTSQWEVDDQVLMEQVWHYESSPSDRRAMLEGLTAMECIEARLCVLRMKLPVAGLRSEP